MFLYAFVKGLKGVLSKKAYGEKYSMAVWALQGGGLQILPYLILSTNLTFICCVYKGKIIKNDSYRRT